MTDLQTKLGRNLLKNLVVLREQKGEISLKDVGDIFISMSASLNPSNSQADQFMHQEISRLANYISEAKGEIFSIAQNDKSELVINDASAHLDEVIKATEEASNTIMDAADKIQGAVAGVGGDKEKEIMDATVNIYNACNFQDITGQRIRKVMKLLANIEERIGKLNELFGTEQSAPDESAHVVDIHAPVDEKDLLNGPQLAGKASSQNEIDALFASLGGGKM